MQFIPTQRDTTKGVTHLLNSDQVAEILGVKPETLSYWRSVGRYHLRYVKVGRLVKYRSSDVEAFIKSRVVTTEVA